LPLDLIKHLTIGLDSGGFGFNDSFDLDGEGFEIKLSAP